jgi:hypothetical protein
MIASERKERVDTQRLLSTIPQIRETQKRIKDEEGVTTRIYCEGLVAVLVVEDWALRPHFDGYRLPIEPEKALAVVRLLKQANTKSQDALVDIKIKLSKDIAEI